MPHTRNGPEESAELHKVYRVKQDLRSKLVGEDRRRIASIGNGTQDATIGLSIMRTLAGYRPGGLQARNH